MPVWFGLVIAFFLFCVVKDDENVVQVFVAGIIPQLTRDPPTTDDIKCYEMLPELGITKFGPRLQGFCCLGQGFCFFLAKHTKLNTSKIQNL